MNETTTAEATAPAQTPAATGAEPKTKKEDSFAAFLVKLVIAVLLFRTLVFTSFSIPSESMMPRLLEGDYLFAAKWPYGYSQASMPFDLKPFSGRVLSRQPERGDVVIFKHPIDRTDYIKRVIGLPGDTIQMLNGVLVLDGDPIRKVRVADFVIPTTVSEGCRRPEDTRRLADSSFVCSYPRYRETLPNGVSYDILDFGPSGLNIEFQVDADNTRPVVVPEGHLFVMGDNRDNSMDSRFPSVAQKGVGLLPQENVVGRASFMFFSTDGNAEWIKPWTWFSAARWSRIGRGI